MADQELESFKTMIDLRAYAASQGYVLDRKASWSGSAVMRHTNGDKISITRDPTDGHYMFYSFRDERDHGSIIDFIQRRRQLTLGDVRKELRLWLGTGGPVMPPYPPLVVTRKDRARIELQFGKTEDALRHPYLEHERGIPAALLADKRFAGRVRIDAQHRNAIFPHFDRDGLCGYEVKNHGFTGFSTGGKKALWRSHEFATDNRLVFCESAIDALSYAALFPDERTRYASIGGQVNPTQPELIRSAAAAMPMGATIVAAMDADEAGHKLSGIVREAVGLTGRDDLRFVAEAPVGFKDWNDQLRAKPTPCSVCRPEEPSVA